MIRVKKRKKSKSMINLNTAMTPAQWRALDEYWHAVRAQSRSIGTRAIIRAGLVALASAAPTERDRDAAAAALALWDADDATPIPPQDPQP